jgi:transposase InsO family protein
MGAASLHGRTPRRFKRTTIADPAAAARADLVRRDFAVDAAAVNTRWCGDITYLPTWEGWLYLATVIDIASPRIVGFAMAEHLRTELVADALTNAIAARDPAPGVISMRTVSMWGPALLGFLTRTAMDARGCWCREAPRLPDPHADRQAACVVFPRIRRWPGSTRRGARLVDGVT